MSGAGTLVDARWAGHGGIGKVTTQLVRGLGAEAPPGEWTVWARDPAVTWPGARTVLARRDPNVWAGQRAALEVPPCHRAIFPANLRPLRPVGRASMMILYDTIPVRYAKTPARCRVGRQVLWAAAHLSTKLLTISAFSASTIMADLGIEAKRISVLPIPLDRTLSEAVAARRPASLAAVPRVFFIGRFARHKNLERLALAFGRSRTARDGGELVLAGGTGPEVDHLAEFCRSIPGGGITVRGQLSHDELIELYASSWVLAFPSLEEGFGLPVIEATAAGVPVVATTGGAIPEVVGGRLPLVDPYDVGALSRAIDDAVSQGGVVDPALRRWTDDLPTEADLARAVLDEVERLR